MTQHTPASARRRAVRTLVAVAGLAPLALGATGCSYITNALHHEVDHHFSSVKDMTGEWDGDAAWVPADATDIRIHASSSGMLAQMRVVTDASLDPSLCAETERLSMWVYPVDWAPHEKSLPEKVYACGDWDVVPMSDGWFGWTPTDLDEQAASPSGSKDVVAPPSTPTGH